MRAVSALCKRGCSMMRRGNHHATEGLHGRPGRQHRGHSCSRRSCCTCNRHRWVTVLEFTPGPAVVASVIVSHPSSRPVSMAAHAAGGTARTATGNAPRRFNFVSYTEGWSHQEAASYFSTFCVIQLYRGGGGRGAGLWPLHCSPRTAHTESARGGLEGSLRRLSNKLYAHN